MNNKSILLHFFELENRRDWVNYERLLHSDVEWILFSAKVSQTISGVENYMNKIKSAYSGNNDSFTCEAVYPGTSDRRIAAILINNRGQRSADIFEFQDGLIRREWEFLLG